MWWRDKSDKPSPGGNMIRSEKTAKVNPVIDEPRSIPTAPPTQSFSASQVAAPSAVIGSKIRFKGELVGEEDLLIQGHVEGTIDLKNHNLTIGEQGVIKANVKARTIVIEGSVDGDLFGEERIVIKESSNVSGNITAERVALEDGAKFRGSIDMDIKSKTPSVTPKTVELAEK